MPHIIIQLSGPRDPALGAHAVAAVNGLAARVLGKRPELMATTLQYLAAEDWFIGGHSLAERGGAAFYVSIRVTDETNTLAEKAAFIDAVHAAMSALRPHVDEVSYVHIIDARASAYGYGGRTQAARHQEAARR